MNITTYTAEEKEALRQKYRDNLAHLKATRTGLLPITKLRQGVKAATLYQWTQERALIVADWNRDEVKNREGNEHEWMESLATKISPGQFIGYYHGKVGENGKIVPTKSCPIVVYEGGHRTRWTMKVFGGEALYCGMTYAELCVLAPETAKAIEEAAIEMTIAVSENFKELDKFARNEYEKVNTKGEGLKAGEVIRAGTDEKRAALEDSLRNSLKRGLKPKKRDSQLEELRALVHGAAGLVEKMDKAKGSLTNIDELTDEQVQKANVVIQSFAQVEEAICAIPELSGKEVKKRLAARTLDLRVDGTLMWALQDAVGAVAVAKVRADWVEYHKRFFADKDVWKAKIAELKAPTNKRRSYERERPFPIRWMRIQAALHPVAVVSVADDIETSELM
jgi:hypothetical protein